MIQIKTGDILINRWAGHIDTRYFIYLGTDGKYVQGLECVQGELKKINYYKSDIKNDYKSNGEKAYEVVGHTNFLDIAKEDLQKFKESDNK